MPDINETAPTLDDVRQAADALRAGTVPEPDAELETRQEEKQPESEEKVIEQESESYEQESSGDDGEVQPEVEEEPPKKPDKDEHRERSDLGRKVKTLQETVEKLSVLPELLEQMQQNHEQQIQFLVSQFATKQPANIQNDGPDASNFLGDPDDLIPERKGEFLPWIEKGIETVIEKRERQRLDLAQRKQAEDKNKRTSYEKAYMRTLSELGATHDDRALHAEATKLITEKDAPYNRFLTGNPKMDAQLNYEAAQAHIFKQRLSRTKEEPKKVPIKNEPPKAPLGATPSGKKPALETRPVKLDAYAQRALERLSEISGKSKDEITKMGFGE